MLPKIKVVSKQSLPPQCPGRTRNNLHLTIGPVEWNPLNSFKPGPDERFYVSVQWWGDKSDGIDLPLSTSRKTTTSYAVKRPFKTLQCYLTDMGTLTLTLYDKNDEVIGAAAVPGIKRLTQENPIREITNIRDSAEGYRLGRLPVGIELRDLRGRQTTSGSSRSRSRSNSARRSRSHSAPRSRSRSNKRSSQSKTSPSKTAQTVVDLSKTKTTPKSIPTNQLATIDNLLSKAADIQRDIAYNQTSLNIPQIPHVTSRPTHSLSFQHAPFVEQTAPPTQHVQRPIQSCGISSTVGLGMARQLPEVKLNIPPLPRINKIYPSASNPAIQHTPIAAPTSFMKPPASAIHNKENIGHIEANQNATRKSRDFNELILGNLESSIHSVDYVPSEVDSLLDEEIIDQIYRINRPMPNDQQFEPKMPVSNEPFNRGDDKWLKTDEILRIEVVELVLPRKKGRPPPSSTEREIDDSFSVEFSLPWSRAKRKSDQIENARFASNRMKSGKIIFRESRSFESVRDVDEPLCLSLYQKTKYRSKYHKIEMVEIDVGELQSQSNSIEIKIQSYALRVLIAKEPKIAPATLDDVVSPAESSADLPTQFLTQLPTQSFPKVSAGGAKEQMAASHPSTVQLFRDIDELAVSNRGTGSEFETSFPISFLLWVKEVTGLPDVREGHSIPGPPLPMLSVRSPLLEEAITCRVSERSNNPKFDCYSEWSRPVLSSQLEMLHQSMFALECWCGTAEQGDKLLGLGRITTKGLASILVGGYALLCAPKFPIIMADGAIPLRDISTNQIRGYANVLLACGTSVQIEQLKQARQDVREMGQSESLKNETLVTESLQVDSVDENDELELDLKKSADNTGFVSSALPNGIPCTISIGHVSNLLVAPGRSLSVSLDTQEGLMATEWDAAGKWNFQKTCVLPDPLPDTLLFHLYSCVSEISNETPLNQVQSREFGWIEMSLHTLGIGFPCINGWYEIRSIGGEIIGQIKLGIAPSSNTPRTFKAAEKSISLQAKLQCQPEQLEQSSKILTTQLMELENLVKTVKYKQRALQESSEECVVDTGTQITPSISRLEENRVELAEPLDRLSIAELQSQQIDVSIRKMTQQVVAVNDLEEFHSAENSSIFDESLIDGSVVEPQVLNSEKQLSDLSKSNPLSSTRIDEASEIASTEFRETDSDAQIEAFVKEFSASMTSIKQNIDESRKIRNEIKIESNKNLVEEESKTEQNNETSVWSGSDDDDSSIKHISSENNFEMVEQVEELESKEKNESPAKLYWTCYSKEEISLDCTSNEGSIDQNVLTNNDIVEETDLTQHSVQHRPESTEAGGDTDSLVESILTDCSSKECPVTYQISVPAPSAGVSLAELALANANEAIESIQVDIPRPPRSKKALNPNQTRRLAAIFGMK